MSPRTHSFFRSRWRLRRQDISPFEEAAGLALDSSVFAAVPGNHDNWNGRGFKSSPAYNPKLYEGHFRQTPWTKAWVSPSGTIQLQLVGIDSNSGLKRPHNKLAQGAIDLTQLAPLSAPVATVGPSVAVVAKAVVCHHSLAYAAPRFSRASLELEAPSRVALLQAAAQHDFAAVLTGHTHDPLRHPFDVQVGLATRRVHELRSATTFQGPPVDGQQGFLLHRIHRSSRTAGYEWSTWRYVYANGAFIREDESTRWPPFTVP